MSQPNDNPETPTKDNTESVNTTEVEKEYQSFEQMIPEEPILERLGSLGFNTPTEVQSLSIPPALEGRDLLVQAQTGSGKTLAFAIPLLASLCKTEGQTSPSQTYALILAPTRELATQVKNVIATLDDQIQPPLLIGGVDSSSQIKSLKQDARIVIGTPGRVLDLLRQKALRLKNCRYFVLDEADEMLSMGFVEDVRAILSRLPDRRQGLFVSATITPRVDMLAGTFLTKPKRIVTGEYTSDVPDIEHYYVEVAGDLMAKPSALCDLIETFRPGSALIFCNTRSDTQMVEALLRRRGFDARRINSDLTQGQRDRIMRQIRAEELRFLVATDIAARGLDIAQIELVINFSIHDQPETYIHRTGRTGRAGKSGKAISLIGPRDVGAFHFLGKVVEIEFKKLPLPGDQEVADARLLHLYQMIREKQIDLSERDLVLGRKLLFELGELSEPPEDLNEIVSKLCRYTIEHFINLEARSLDEEIDDTPEENRRDRSNTRSRREDGSQNRSSRGRERDRHSEDRRGDRRGDRDYNSRRSNRSRDYQSGNSNDSRERGRSRDDRHSNSRTPRNRDSADDFPEEVRLYIGQGALHGMTLAVFKDLALEFGELQGNDLRKLTIREHYGFVDLYRPQAERLKQCLNGIEYNGNPLPIEFAAALSHKPARRRGPHRPQGREQRQGRHGRGRHR